MRSRILILGVLVCLLLLVVPAVGQATTAAVQTQWQTTVPFEFWVGTDPLPAGEYTILSDPSNGLIVLRNTSTGHILLRYTRNIEVKAPVEKSELKFMMNDGKHVLHQVWMQGDMHGHDILHGQEVREMEPK